MSKLILIASLIFGATQAAHAQTFKVIKSKGNRAVIQMPRGQTLEKGMTYSVADGDGGSLDSRGVAGSESGGSRSRVLGVSADLFVGSTKTEVGSVSTSQSTTRLNFEGRYGWNHVKMEYGPIAGLTYSSAGNSSSRTLSGGAFFDYNLVPNQDGTDVVYGLGAVGSIGLTSQKSGNSSSSTGNQILLGGGGQLKWFPFNYPLSVRGDAQLRFTRTTYGSTTLTESGLYLAGGLQAYF